MGAALSSSECSYNLMESDIKKVIAIWENRNGKNTPPLKNASPFQDTTVDQEAEEVQKALSDMSVTELKEFAELLKKESKCFKTVEEIMVHLSQYVTKSSTTSSRKKKLTTEQVGGIIGGSVGFVILVIVLVVTLTKKKRKRVKNRSSKKK
jgi:hypothetical protein